MADHYDLLQRSACGGHRAPQNLRVRLLNAKCVLPTNRNEAISESKSIKQVHGKMLKLVGTYCKTTVSCCERVECIYESWKRTRALGQVIALVRDELFKHSLDPRKNAPIGFEGTNIHRLCFRPASKGSGAKPSRAKITLSVWTRSGAVSISVPSRSKTMVGAGMADR